MKTPEQIADTQIEVNADGILAGDEAWFRAQLIAAIKADRAQRPTPDTHCFREESPTERCETCGWLAENHTGCDCEDS